MLKELNKLLDITGRAYSTCSLSSYKDRCVTFIKNESYIDGIKYIKHTHLIVLIPKDLKLPFEISEDIKLFESTNVDLLFTLYHNYIHEYTDPSVNDVISLSATIHPSAVVGVDGIKIAMWDKRKILFKHVGNIIIEKDVDIGANAVIHRARLDSTTIKKGTIIGALTNIAHNVTIGEDCIITTNVSVGGSVTIGNNCWIGMGATIRNGVSICDNVVIGMGSVVLESINQPGFYVGNPAKFLRKFEPGNRGF